MITSTQPATMDVLRIYYDSKGNKYELRGKEETSSLGTKTKTLGLYKENKYGAGFTQIREKEEKYLLDNNTSAQIKKTQFDYKKKPVETTEISRQLSGYDIKVNNDALKMNDTVKVLITTGSDGDVRTKVKLPQISINGDAKFSPVTKRVIKLFAKI